MANNQNRPTVESWLQDFECMVTYRHDEDKSRFFGKEYGEYFAFVPKFTEAEGTGETPFQAIISLLRDMERLCTSSVDDVSKKEAAMLGKQKIDRGWIK